MLTSNFQFIFICCNKLKFQGISDNKPKTISTFITLYQRHIWAFFPSQVVTQKRKIPCSVWLKISKYCVHDWHFGLFPSDVDIHASQSFTRFQNNVLSGCRPSGHERHGVNVAIITNSLQRMFLISKFNSIRPFSFQTSIECENVF